jgi:hypothetical protein
MFLFKSKPRRNLFDHTLQNFHIKEEQERRALKKKTTVYSDEEDV